MQGTYNQINAANIIIKEWRDHAAKKRSYYNRWQPTAEGLQLLDRADIILEERISALNDAAEIVRSRYLRKFDYEAIFEELCYERCND